MTEVMPEAPSAVSDRSHLYAFLTATDASATALERPVGRGWVGDYQISGKTGHVLANGTGYLLYVHIDERTAMEREPSSRRLRALSREAGPARSDGLAIEIAHNHNEA